jgi:hypothetical protein
LNHVIPFQSYSLQAALEIYALGRSMRLVGSLPLDDTRLRNSSDLVAGSIVKLLWR